MDRKGKIICSRSFCFFVLLMHVCNSCCSNCTSCCLLCKPERCLINLETLPSELGAIERLKISHRLIMGKWCLQASTFIFHWIFVKLAGNQDRHKISDVWIPARSDQSLWSYVPFSAKRFLIYLHFQTWISLRPVGQSWSNFTCSINRWGGGGGGKAALDLGIDWITTVLVMATKSSHWLIMRKMVSQSFFIRSSPNLQVAKTGAQSHMSSNSSQIGSITWVLRALEHWKNFS